MNLKAILEKSFADLLRAKLPVDQHAEFAGVDFFQSQRSGALSLPAVVVTCVNASELIPDSGAHKAQVEVMVKTSINEESGAIDDEHQMRVSKVEAVLRDKSAIVQFFAATDIYIYNTQSSDQPAEVDDNAYSDIITVMIDFHVLPA